MSQTITSQDFFHSLATPCNACHRQRHDDSMLAPAYGAGAAPGGDHSAAAFGLASLATQHLVHEALAGVGEVEEGGEEFVIDEGRFGGMDQPPVRKRRSRLYHDVLQTCSRCRRSCCTSAASCSARWLARRSALGSTCCCGPFASGDGGERRASSSRFSRSARRAVSIFKLRSSPSAMVATSLWARSVRSKHHGLIIFSPGKPFPFALSPVEGRLIDEASSFDELRTNGLETAWTENLGEA
jgi:hypothetical protein